MYLTEKFKTIKKMSKHSILTTVCILILICAVSFTMIGFVVPKEITIIDGGTEKTVHTSRIYVEELLSEQGIALRFGDQLSTAFDTTLRDGDVITIVRAKKIFVEVDGETREIYSTKSIVSEALADNGITLNEHDDITPYLETPLTEGMKVQIFRVQITEEKVTEAIPFKTYTRVNNNYSAGTEVVSVKGSEGVEEVTYKVVTVDGEEFSREEVSRNVIKKPVNRVVEKGGQSSSAPTSAANLKYKKVIECTATAYTASNGARTASGKVAAYGIIAVDPKVIPMGTKLYIEAADGSWVYGHAVAGDTGGAIKGNKIDLFYNTTAECLKFGRRTAKVYILE